MAKLPKNILKAINQANNRLRALKKLHEPGMESYSYKYALSELEDISGITITKGGYISTSVKSFDIDHYPGVLRAIEMVVPTAGEEMKEIQSDIEIIDKWNLRNRNIKIPQRNKAQWIKEVSGKRYFDLIKKKKDKSFEQYYEEWNNTQIYNYGFYDSDLGDLVNMINEKLGKGVKGKRTHGQLMEIERLMDEYWSHSRI